MGKTNKVSLEQTTVKPLKESEIDKAAHIYLEAFHGMAKLELAKQWLRCNLQAFPQKMCFGVWLDDSLLGYIVWTEKGTFRSEAVWELEQIAVLGEYRGQGIGEKLIRNSLSEVEARLKERQANLKLIMVTTGVTNESARLYEKVLGAKQESVIKDFYNGDEQIMLARFRRGKTSLSSDDKMLLRLEYQECQAGYNNRDKIIPDELRNVGIVFTLLTGVLIFAINLLRGLPAGWEWLFWLVAGVIGVFGLSFLFGFLADIQSNVGCKRALRQRSIEIEELLSPAPRGTKHNTPLQIWRSTIPERDRKWGERGLKNLFNKISPEGETDYFILATEIAIGLWFLLVVLGAILGPHLPLSQPN